MLAADYITDFTQVKKTAHGMLSVQDYETLYRYAAHEAAAGNIVEIGPARGASTIALALGAKASGQVSRVISIDTFLHSHATKTWDDMDANIADLEHNLEAFGCRDIVDVMVAGQEDWDFIYRTSISLMFIDADGALDRDFKNYYDHLLPGCWVFIDDCANIIKGLGRTCNVRERCGWVEDIREDSAKILKSPALLGKYYITWRFVRCLVEQGLFEVAHEGSPILLRKPDPAPTFSADCFTAMQAVKAEVENQFLEARLFTREAYSALEEPLHMLRDAACPRDASGTCDAAIFESYRQQNRLRFYMVWGQSADPERTMPLFERFWEDEARPILDKLGSGRYAARLKNRFRLSPFERVLAENGYSHVECLPLASDDKPEGFVALLYRGKPKHRDNQDLEHALTAALNAHTAASRKAADYMNHLLDE